MTHPIAPMPSDAPTAPQPPVAPIPVAPMPGAVDPTIPVAPMPGQVDVYAERDALREQLDEALRRIAAAQNIEGLTAATTAEASEILGRAKKAWEEREVEFCTQLAAVTQERDALHGLMHKAGEEFAALSDQLKASLADREDLAKRLEAAEEQLTAPIALETAPQGATEEAAPKKPKKS